MKINYPILGSLGGALIRTFVSLVLHVEGNGLARALGAGDSVASQVSAWVAIVNELVSRKVAGAPCKVRPSSCSSRLAGGPKR
eukprot:6487403-Amphidinium_carterae.2